jgi:hypothetical protein
MAPLWFLLELRQYSLKFWVAVVVAEPEETLAAVVVAAEHNFVTA